MTATWRQQRRRLVPRHPSRPAAGGKRGATSSAPSTAFMSAPRSGRSRRAGRRRRPGRRQRRSRRQPAPAPIRRGRIARGRPPCGNTAPTSPMRRPTRVSPGRRRRLPTSERELGKRIALLEAKTAETAEVGDAPRRVLEEGARELVQIYTRMRPDAAAAQLSAMDEETASAVLIKLEPRTASLILNEMEPAQAARLTAIIGGAARIAPAGACAGGSGGEEIMNKVALRIALRPAARRLRATRSEGLRARAAPDARWRRAAPRQGRRC